MDDHERKDQFDRKLLELGARYLARTAHELGSLRDLLDQPTVGLEAVTQLGQVAHRIHGSGAMLGFRGITECVRPLNSFMNAREPEPLSAQELEYVRQQLNCVAEAVDAAVESNSVALLK